MIVDLDTGVCLARAPRTAAAFADRLRGMIGRRFDDRLDAMVFPRCNAIHTCFMREPIDLLFLDRGDIALRIDAAVPPWRLCRRARGAATVVEFPAGHLAETGVQTGHRVQLNRISAADEVAKARSGGILIGAILQEPEQS